MKYFKVLLAILFTLLIRTLMNQISHSNCSNVTIHVCIDILLGALAAITICIGSYITNKKNVKL